MFPNKHWTSSTRPVHWQERVCTQDTRILTLLVFSSSGRYAMLKNVSTQTFTWIGARSIWTMALGRWKLFFMRAWPVSLCSIRYRFFHPPQPPSISHLKAFCSDLCWHVLCETMTLVWLFPQPSFPIQWQDTISSNKHYSSSSCKTALIFHF